MPIAGEYLDPSRYSGARIATTIRTSASAGFTTTEVTIDSVTAALVSGRIYRVRWVTSFSGGGVNNTVRCRLREDSATGTQLQLINNEMPTASFDYWVELEAEYTAVSTGNKTFVGTAVRLSGANTIGSNSSSIQPTYLYVDYVRG